MDDGTNRAKRRVVLRGLTWVSGNTRECTTWGGGGSMDDGTNRAKRRVVLRELTWVSGNTRECTTWGEHGRWNQQSEEESGP